jgi:hypothetical protein
VFDRLTDSDAEMVNFIHTQFFATLDEFVKEAGACLDKLDMKCAEARRLQLKANSTALVPRLHQFGGDLSQLVIEFARLAKVPVTLVDQDD